MCEKNNKTPAERDRERERGMEMALGNFLNLSPEVMIQAVILVLALGMVFALHSLSRQAFTRLRRRNHANDQSRRHFVHGAQLLARARSAGKGTTISLTLARSAREEADRAISLDPRDSAAYILKALALDFQGHRVSALKSLDVALSPSIAKSLSPKEQGDALFKRAELQLAVNRRRRTEAAMADLVEAVKLSPENGKAFCLLGGCYEERRMTAEAKMAYESAIQVDGSLSSAQEALERLAGSR